MLAKTSVKKCLLFFFRFKEVTKSKKNVPESLVVQFCCEKPETLKKVCSHVCTSNNLMFHCFGHSEAHDFTFFESEDTEIHRFSKEYGLRELLKTAV